MEHNYDDFDYTGGSGEAFDQRRSANEYALRAK